MAGSYNRVNKARVRREAFEHLDRHATGVHESILTLPSREALCVHALHSTGMIDHDTRQLWIENDPKRRRYLDFERAKFLGPIDIHIGDLEDAPIDHNLDLVNCDMESGMTARLATWMADTLAPRMIQGTDFVATFTQWSRHNPLYDWLNDNQDDCLLTPHIHALRLTHGTIEPKIIYPMILLSCALQIDATDTIATFEYGDGRTKMISFAIPNVHRAPGRFPPISEVIAVADLGKRTFERSSNVGPDLLARVHAKLETMLMRADEIDGVWVVTLRQSRATEIGRYPSLEEVAERFQA